MNLNKNKDEDLEVEVELEDEETKANKRLEDSPLNKFKDLNKNNNHSDNKETKKLS